jgi:hypothetical protein
MEASDKIQVYSYCSADQCNCNSEHISLKIKHLITFIDTLICNDEIDVALELILAMKSNVIKTQLLKQIQFYIDIDITEN